MHADFCLSKPRTTAQRNNQSTSHHHHFSIFTQRKYKPTAMKKRPRSESSLDDKDADVTESSTKTNRHQRTDPRNIGRLGTKDL